MTADPLTGVELPPASTRQAAGRDDAEDRAAAIRMMTLRVNGMTYQQIADELGYSDKSNARQALLRALDRHEAENASQLRTLENERLDADERALRGIILDGKQPAATRIRAVDARTRVAARRARLNGLDAPLQVAISAGVQAELTDALAELEDVLRLTQQPDGSYAAEDAT